MATYIRNMTQIIDRLSRRGILLGGVAGTILAACSNGKGQAAEAVAAEAEYSDTQWRQITEAEWRERLSPEAFEVLRKDATERAGSSPLNEEKREGTFHCKGCDLPLFKSEWKYMSGTGWPSFWTYIEGNLATRPDNTLLMQRTEYHCARCLGHQGHVFEDGPEPTGLRYCNNGVALTFKPANA
ncbi:peptide-methionine (R)-S-oxide reductase MsrB [Henriciella sp.]|uniref:peptide-methionine (R)-S-oxide reductase MsrB n=1 Tax=Henriciella sp. TaxID=1968823 RepID=UPI002624E8BD|nr:peptide-methionine (R)-S-oxide reductase MsrB [Henriciella sp.]